MTTNPFLLYLRAVGPILVGLIAVFIWYRKSHVRMPVFAWGALAWTVSVAMKFAVAIPFNQPLLKYLVLNTSTAFATTIFVIYAGLLTGVFECVIPYVGVRFTRFRDYSFNEAIAFGVGFGAIEAILLGGYMVFATPASIPSLYLLPTNTIERVSAIIIHVCTCLLIFVSIKQKNLSFLWFSMAIKTLVDGGAGWFNLAKPALAVHGVWLFELVAALVAVFLYSLILFLRNRFYLNAQSLHPAPA